MLTVLAQLTSKAPLPPREFPPPHYFCGFQIAFKSASLGECRWRMFGQSVTKQRIGRGLESHKKHPRWPCGKLHSVNRPTPSISSEPINLFSIPIVRKYLDINFEFRFTCPFFLAGLFLHSLDGQHLSFEYMNFSIEVPGLLIIIKLPVYYTLDLSCKDICNAVW